MGAADGTSAGPDVGAELGAPVLLWVPRLDTKVAGGRNVGTADGAPADAPVDAAVAPGDSAVAVVARAQAVMGE